jgi:hypothetical protein
LRITAAGTAPVLHRIPLHRQADMPSRLPIPGVKIKTFYILFSFFFLIIFFFLHFVFLSVVFLCFCKGYPLQDRRWFDIGKPETLAKAEEYYR